MKLQEIESTARKARASAQAAGRKFKDLELQAKAAEEKSHQARLKFKQARKHSKKARKDARRAREEADDAQKVFAKATALAAKAEAKAAKGKKKSPLAKAKAKPRVKSTRPPQLKPMPKLKPQGTAAKKSIVPVMKPIHYRPATSQAPKIISPQAKPPVRPSVPQVQPAKSVVSASQPLPGNVAKSVPAPKPVPTLPAELKNPDDASKPGSAGQQG